MSPESKRVKLALVEIGVFDFMNSKKNAYTGLHPWLEENEKLEAEIFIDGAKVTTLKYEAPYEGVNRIPAEKLMLPPALKNIRIKGKLHSPESNLDFDTTWNTFDIGKYTAPLYDTSQNLVERIQNYAEGLAKLERKTEDSENEFYNPIEIEELNEDDQYFALTNERLNLKLPEILKFMTRYRIRMGDNFFRKLSDWNTVSEVLRNDWSYEEDGENPLSKIVPDKLLSRFDRSILIFEECGDGLGALAWDPNGIESGEFSNLFFDKHSNGANAGPKERGMWYWIHQDTLTEPEMLLDSKLVPVDAEAAILNAFQRFAVDPDTFVECLAPEDFDEPYSIVDSSHPRGMQLLIIDKEDGDHSLRDGSYDYTITMAL